VARRGRPKGGDSAETRQRIIDAARVEFAARGFDGASIATIATKSDLAPSAVYHYFGGKAALYEEVFDATNEAVWEAVRIAATGHDTVLANIEAMVSFTITMSPELRAYSDFLALMPMETMLHPEFKHMIEHRTKFQDSTFGALAELGLRTGELRGFDVESATELLRSAVMGWFFETYYTQSSGVRGGKALVTMIRLLGQR